MTRERKIPKGPHKGELETRIVPVVLFEPLDVHKIRRGVAWRGVNRPTDRQTDRDKHSDWQTLTEPRRRGALQNQRVGAAQDAQGNHEYGQGPPNWAPMAPLS